MRRILWVAATALTRAALHALMKVDALRDDSLKAKVAECWKELNNSKPRPHIFWEFLEIERNLVLKQFEFGPDLADSNLLLEDGGVMLAEDGSNPCLETFFSIRTDRHFRGRDGRDVLREAIEWAECYISQFEEAPQPDAKPSLQSWISRLRGRGSVRMSTDEVLRLTRGR